MPTHVERLAGWSKILWMASWAIIGQPSVGRLALFDAGNPLPLTRLWPACRVRVYKRDSSFILPIRIKPPRFTWLV